MPAILEATLPVVTAPAQASRPVALEPLPPAHSPDGRPLVRVAAFGLGPRLRRIAEIVFRHARHNPYRFEVVVSREPEDFDLALVDMTVWGGAEVARTLRGLPKARAVVTVGRRQDPGRTCDDLCLQRFALNLINVLNRVVESRLDREQIQGKAQASAKATGQAHWLATLGRRPRVLLLEPGATARRQLTLAISALGLQPDAVASLAEARESLAQRRYEVMLLEWDLPDGSGLSLVRDIRRHRLLRATATLMLTRRDGPLDKLRAAAAGCDAYLVKPASTLVLRETLLRCLASPILEVPGVPTGDRSGTLARLSATLRFQPQL